MTKPNLCWAKWAIGKRVWGVSNDCDQRKARFKKRLESTAWPPVKRNTVYMCTFIHMHKHGFLCRHMYTVHRTHGSSGWLIQQHIRSLTVTNSWKTDEHKKAHTLTPNLWGGLGQRRRGSDLAAGLSPSQLLFLFSPFFFPYILLFTSSVSPPSFRLAVSVLPFFHHFLLLGPHQYLCKVFCPPSLSFLGSDRFPLSSFILEAEKTAVWCDPSLRRWRERSVPDHRPYQSHS